MNNYLKDFNFLKQLDLENRKEQFIKITLLNFKTEAAIASIEGKSTGGNVNLSGTSNVRRTLSCSLLVDRKGISKQGSLENVQYANITEVQNIISMNKKVRVEIGFKNTLTKLGMYEDIDMIWIPLGVFVIKTASSSKNNSGINISLTATDKTTLINGDVGGTIPAAMVLSEMEEYSANASERKVTQLLIKDLIRYVIVDLGGEDANRVIIDDIPNVIRKVVKWTGKDVLYLVRNNGSLLYTIDKRVADQSSIINSFTFGQDCGYFVERFCYPGKLECAAGDSVAAILDKIKNALGGNYEWFYDVYGFFHFQEKKNYINSSQIISVENLNKLDYLSTMNKDKFVYSFDENNRKLISSISNAPQYQNIKNDFVVWGATKTASGATKAIRYHLAFDTKPAVDKWKERLCIVYTDYRGLQQVIVLNNNNMVDLIENSSASLEDKNKYYLTQNENNKYIVSHWDEETQSFRVYPEWELCYLRTDDWRTELYYLCIEDSNKTFAKNYYAAELNAEWPKIYDVKAKRVNSGKYGAIYTGAYRDIHPSSYEYFLDFLGDNGSGLSQFNINNIGRRTKVGKDNTANCVFAYDVPNVIIINADGNTQSDYENIISGYEATQVGEDIYNNLVVGGNSTSAFDKVKELIIQHTNYNEAINLTIIPIYYLEPNSRVHIEDTELGVYGDYMINSISLPLTIGTSNLSCTRCIEKTI